MGKRLVGRFFVESVAAHGMHACNYLLACDMEMDPVPGYRLTSWESGYGDFRCVPDWQTLRRAAWLEKTAIVLCDVATEPGANRSRSRRAGPPTPDRAGRRDGLRRARGLRDRALPLPRELRLGSPEESTEDLETFSGLHRGLPRLPGNERRAARRERSSARSRRAACRWRDRRGNGAGASRS